MLLNTLALVIIINGQLLLTIILFILKRRKILRSNNSINQTDSQIINSVNDFNQDMPFITTQSSESN